MVVVGLRETMNWFERRPLFGQTVVVTRTRQQASELSERLTQLGASVIEAPTIELAPPDEFSGVDEALRHIANYDWVVFTSANGVAFTKQRLTEHGLDRAGRLITPAVAEERDHLPVTPTTTSDGATVTASRRSVPCASTIPPPK